jgi:5'-nucleotidase
MPVTDPPPRTRSAPRTAGRAAWAAWLCAAAATLALLGCGAPPAAGPTPSSAPPPAPPPAPEITVRLIGFNDLHGHLEPAGLSLPWPDPAQPGRALPLAAGGIASLAGTVSALRAGATHSVLLSSGDHIGAAPLVSSLFLHESTIDLMNRMGVDLAIVGNHEFDAGTAELDRLLRGGCARLPASAVAISCALGPHPGARFPHLAANVEREDGSALLPRSQVLAFDGVRIGFIGAVSAVTPEIVSPAGVAGLRFVDEAEAINREAERLLAQGVRALVAVIHEGGATGTPGMPLEWNDAGCPNPRGPIFDIVRRLHPQIDLVFSAHTHQGYRCDIDGRWVMQATAQGRGLSVADVVVDRASGDIVRSRSRLRNLPVFNPASDATLRAAIVAAEPEPWASALRAAQPDAAIAARLATYSAQAAPRAQRPVGRIGAPFARMPANANAGDSAAGRLVADAQWAATRDPALGGARFALTNPGGVRSDLPCRDTPPCTVTYGDAYTMQPFGNSLVVMTLNGAEIRALLESQQRADGPPYLLIPSSQLRYRWQRSAAPGQRVQDLRLDGEPLDPAREVRFTVNSFLADGGDGFAALRHGRDRLGGAQDLDALIDFLARERPSPDPAARITLVD